MGQARDDGHGGHDDPGDLDGAVLAAHLAEEVGAEVLVVGGGPGDDEAGRDGQQQGGDLRDEAVAHAQQAVGVGGVGDRQVALGDADGEAADEVDGGDDDGGDGVAPDELGGPVHGPVEVGLVGDLLAAALGLLLVDEPRVQVGVDRHLLAGHGVEGEAGRHLGHAARTRGDHHELDDDEDEEHHQPDDEIAAHDEVAEAVDHRAGVAVEQDEPGGGDVEGQAEQRGDQQDGGEDREVERLLHVHGHEQHDHGARDVQADEDVEQEGRQRHDEHHDDGDDGGRDADHSESVGHDTSVDERTGPADPWPSGCAPSWRPARPSTRAGNCLRVWAPVTPGVTAVRPLSALGSATPRTDVGVCSIPPARLPT